MNKLLILIIVLATLSFGVSDVLASPGINRKINFQGKVVNKGVGDTDGTNVPNGNYDFKFSLWSTSTVGTSIWSEVWNSGTTQVDVRDGIFNVALGTYRTFPPTVDFNSDNIYVSVNFNNDGEMTPRVQMTAVPYAFNAEKVGGLTVTNTTGTLTIPDGSLIEFGDSFVTTGVGITLDQNLSTSSIVNFGGLSIGGSVSFTNIPVGTGTTVLYIGAGGNLLAGTLPIGGQSYTATNGLNLNGSSIGLGGSLTQNTQIGTSSFSLSYFGLGGTLGLYQSSSGLVGVGVNNPRGTLHLYGNGTNGAGSRIIFGDDYGSSGQLNAYIGEALWPTSTDTDLIEIHGRTGLIFTTDGSGGMNDVKVSMYIDATNNVGIGTTNQTHKLEVNGDMLISTNLTVGGTLSLTGIPVGIGSTVLYIGANGNIVAGTLPAGGQSYTATNGLNLNGSALGLGGTLSANTLINTSTYSLSLLGVGNSQSLFVGTSGYVGIGTTNPQAKLDVFTYPPTAAITKNIQSTVNARASAGANGVGYGLYNDLTGSGNGGGGTIGDIYGVYNYMHPSGYTVSYGLYNDVTSNVFSVNYGSYYKTNSSSSGGTQYAYFADMNLGSATKIGLYVTGETNNYLSGMLGVGETSTAFKLNVSGNARITTNLSIGGTLNLTGLPLGTGTTMLFMDGSGNIIAGTLPDSGQGKSRIIVLSPEFAGAALTADGSINTGGTMTSDNSRNAGGTGWKNYYEWASGNANLQDYSIILRVTLPADFDTWETGSCPGATCALQMSYQMGVGTTDDNYVSYAINNDTDNPGSTVCTIGTTATTSWGSSGCTESVLNDGSAPEWDAAGETAVIRIKMAAKNTSSALVRIGDIILRYKSKF